LKADLEQDALVMYVDDQCQNVLCGRPLQHFEQWAQQDIVNPAPLLAWYETEYPKYIARYFGYSLRKST